MVVSGAGYFYDDVLEYRVWVHPEAGGEDLHDGDDYFLAFAKFDVGAPILEERSWGLRTTRLGATKRARQRTPAWQVRPRQGGTVYGVASRVACRQQATTRLEVRPSSLRTAKMPNPPIKLTPDPRVARLGSTYFQYVKPLGRKPEQVAVDRLTSHSIFFVIPASNVFDCARERRRNHRALIDRSSTISVSHSLEPISSFKANA